MNGEVRTCRWFVDHYAPLGYAALYARLGDFGSAQRALAKTLREGFDEWERSLPDGRPELGARLMARLAGNYEPTVEESTPAASGVSSFSRSRKLGVLQQTLAIVRRFPEPEQVALVLLAVEEVSEELITRWLALDAAALADLRGRVAARLEEAQIPTPPGEDHAAFFHRTMRQYRLPAGFSAAIRNRVQVSRFQSAELSAVGIFVLAVAAALLLPCLFSNAVRPRGYNMFWSSAIPILAVDVMLFVAAILLSNRMSGRLARLLPSGSFAGAVPTLLRFCGAVGWLFPLFDLAFVIGDASPMGESDAWRLYTVLHGGWEIVTAALLIGAVSKIVSLAESQLSPQEKAS